LEFSADLRSRHLDQALNLPPVDDNARYFQQVLTGGLITFPGGGPRSQTDQGWGKAMDQAQGLIQGGASLTGGLVVKVIAPQVDGAKDTVHLQGPLGMAFFAGTAGVLWNVQSVGFQQAFQQAASILEQSLAQAQLNGLQIAHPVAGEPLLDQSQEGFCFPELLFLDLLGLEFFLTSGSPAANWVI
jgi:hypothetical protein